MAETYFPFDAGAGSSITEDQWRKMAKFWTRSGVYRGELNGLAPTANGSGMQVFVDTGRAWIEGHFYENDASKTLAIAAADPTNPRIDRIVLKLDTAANTIALVIKTGTPAGSPTPPARVFSGTTYELPVAQVLVDAAATSITAPKITDERCYASQGPALDRLDFRSAADAIADVDLRRTGAGTAQLTGALTVTSALTASGTLHVVGAATLDSTLNVAGKVTISAGGLDVAGSPSGYAGDELRFASTGGSGSHGLSTIDTGSPNMMFDHRATSNTGAWVWNNGTGAATNRMTLSSAGLLSVTGGLDVSGSPSGYGGVGELRSSQTGGIALTTSAGTSPDMGFHHRNTSNTGTWSWANGSAAGTSRMSLSAAGVLTIGGNLVVNPTGPSKLTFSGQLDMYDVGATSTSVFEVMRTGLITNGETNTSVYYTSTTGGTSGLGRLKIGAAGTGPGGSGQAVYIA